MSDPTFNELPRRARIYIPLVLAIAAATVLLTTRVGSPAPLDLAVLAAAGAACAAASLFEVLAPGHYSLQPNLAIFVGAAVMLPTWAMALLAVVCFAPGWTVNRPAWYKAAFNVGNYALAGAAAHAIAQELGAFTSGHEPQTALVLLAAAVTFAGLNHLLVVLAVGFARDLNLRESLAQITDGLPLDVALAVTGACLAVLWQAGAVLVLLAAGPMVLVHRALWIPMLEHRARTDAKTGLFNFGHLKEELGQALEAARRRHGELSVVMVDLDHLRAVNNTYGHLAGDRVIRAVADALAQAAAGRGVAARFGGEEFCLLLPGHGVDAAQELVESLRASVAALRFRVAGAAEPIAITLSAGLAAFPEHGDTIDSLLEAADEAVYEAKTGGRNRVRIAAAMRPRRVPAGRSEVGSGASRRPVTEPPAPVAAPPRNAPVANAREEEPATDPRPDDPGCGPAEEQPPGDARTLATRGLGIYAAALCLAAAGMALLSQTAPIAGSPILFVLLVAAVVGLDLVNIDLFERGKISPGSVPGLALAFAFGPPGPLAAEVLAAAMRAARGEPARLWSIDLGILSLAGGAAGATFMALPTRSGGGLLAAAALGSMVYYVVNGALLAVAWRLSEGGSPFAAWRERLGWAWGHYLAYGALAGVFLLFERQLGAYAFAALVLPVFMIWLSQKQYLDRSRSGVTELRLSHTELEHANTRLQGLLEDNEELLGRMHRSYISTISSLARTIEAKDPYTGGHTDRVADIAGRIAVELGLNESELRALEVGAVIHDIGKIGIPDAILLKPGRLTSEELAEMRRHPEISSYIVADLELPPIVKQVVRNHHERFDGNGYPDRLAGEDIPIAARILSVADALDAMTSDRPYRSALPLAVARAELEAQAGAQFCPRVLAALQGSIERSPADWAELDGAHAARGASSTV